MPIGLVVDIAFHAALDRRMTLFGSVGLLIALPTQYSAGRWVVATPERPERRERRARRFLVAMSLGTPLTTGRAAAKADNVNQFASRGRNVLHMQTTTRIDQPVGTGPHPTNN